MSRWETHCILSDRPRAECGCLRCEAARLGGSPRVGPAPPVPRYVREEDLQAWVLGGPPVLFVSPPATHVAPAPAPAAPRFPAAPTTEAPAMHAPASPTHFRFACPNAWAADDGRRHFDGGFDVRDLGGRDPTATGAEMFGRARCEACGSELAARPFAAPPPRVARFRWACPAARHDGAHAPGHVAFEYAVAHEPDRAPDFTWARAKRLSGRVRCGGCDEPMHLHRLPDAAPGDEGTVRRYRWGCSGRLAHAAIRHLEFHYERGPGQASLTSDDAIGISGRASCVCGDAMELTRLDGAPPANVAPARRYAWRCPVARADAGPADVHPRFELPQPTADGPLTEARAIERTKRGLCGCGRSFELVELPAPVTPDARPIVMQIDIAAPPPTPTEEASAMDPKHKPTAPPSDYVLQPQAFGATLLDDAADATWRTAGSQFVKLARDPLVGLLARHLGPDDPALRARIAAFLQTDVGTALLAGLLSLGLAALPAGAGEVPQRLARELRVRAMGEVGDVVADVLMGPLRQVIALYLHGGVPAAPPAPGALPEGPGASLHTATTTTTLAGEPVGVPR